MAGDGVRTLAHTRVFDEAYAQHRDRVYHWALRYGGGNTAWAEDVVHDVFMRLWDRLPGLAGQEDLGGWLYRVTANVAISRLRGERTFGAKVARFFGRDEASSVPRADEAMDERQRGAAALAALQSLPDRQRVVLSMKFLDGQSQREIAEALGMSEGYVSKLVARGVEQLQAVGWEVDDAAS